MIAIFLSALAMSVIVALRYLATSGGFALWTARRFPQRLAGQRAQVRREIGCQKGVLHRNNGANKKARLAKAVAVKAA